MSQLGEIIESTGRNSKSRYETEKKPKAIFLSRAAVVCRVSLFAVMKLNVQYARVALACFAR